MAITIGSILSKIEMQLLDGDLRRSERESQPVRIIEKQRIFTLDEWNKSGLELDQYLQYPCEIDEDMYNHIAECVAPWFCHEGIVQSGEPMYADGLFVMYRATAFAKDDRYFYLGILPEFKQSDC